MFTIMFLRCVLRSTVVWSLHFEAVDAFLALLLVEFALRLLHTFMHDDRTWASFAKKICYSMNAGAVAYLLKKYSENESDWYFWLLDGVDAVLYVSFIFYCLSSLAKIMDSADRKRGASVAVYRIRKFLYNTYLVSALSMSLYYVTEVVSLLDKSNNSMSLSNTTRYDNSSVDRCIRLDKHDEILDNLYDSTEFTLDCAHEVWRRNRINVLAWLQVKILFGLTWRLSHVKNKLKKRHSLFYQIPAQEITVLKLTLVQVLKYVFLFFAVTLWFDDIQDWYLMPTSSAALFTVYVFLEDLYEKTTIAKFLASLEPV